ncbi:MAG: acyl-CoA dehydrogenase family protein [Proteobacteria bacterium]|nr:acyl-CoA dehydrogenase family protein [Pseudomonadota bacterium]
MNFELDDLHRTIRDTARQFARDEVAPRAVEWDEQERFPSEIIPRLGELGFLGVLIPEAYGGAGLDTLAYAIVVEEISRADGSLGLTLASHNGLGSSHLASFGSEEQKQRYLPKLASGQWLGAWCLTEPGSGSDSVSMQTRAVRNGDGWLINGSKMFVTQGSVAGVWVVLAKTDVQAGSKGVTAFALERDTPGFRIAREVKKLGMRSSDTAEIVLDNARVADAQRVGECGSGFVDAMQILDKGRISIGALALGLGEGALESAIQYAKERRQFGKPIADFQAIQWMLADARAELDAARLLLWRAAWLADTGRPFRREAAMAKLFASEAAQRACDHALQIHGGYGYTREFPVERHLRDVRLCRIGEGTSEVQRMLIARDLLG